MKKIAKLFVICAVALAFCLVMGCNQPAGGGGGDNPSGGDTGGGGNSGLIGTWNLTSSSAPEPAASTAGAGAWYPKKAVFNAGGKGLADVRYSNGSNWTDISNEPASWSSTSSTIIITPDNSAASPITLSYTLSGSTLTCTPQVAGWPTFTYTKQ